MAELIWDFNTFMNMNFESICMGLTPSGNIHIGFLSTLACALLYLKEHPTAHLIITNIENSLASRLEKYHGVPLRFQYFEEGQLIIPVNYAEVKKRDSAASRVHGEVTSLIWKLASIFDKHTAEEIKNITAAFIPPEHKKWLELKENMVFHVYGTQIYVYSFLKVLENDRAFRNNIIGYLTDVEFAKVVGPLCGLKPDVYNFGNQIIINGKKYRPTCLQIPIRLYCPNCLNLCPDWAVVVFGHPELHGPTLAAKCKNVGKCPRADMEAGYDGYVYHNMKDALDMAEFHFMLDPMRDFFQPFKSDCHIFGGDYFQLEYERSGVTAISKIQAMFEYLEAKTGQKKYFFGGPLITVGGRKMSKTAEAFNIKDIKSIKKVFLTIVSLLEEARTKFYPKGIQLEYTDIIKKTA